MWRILKRSVITLLLLAFLIWSGAASAFLALIPVWTWIVAFSSVALVAVFVARCWDSNEVTPLPPEQFAIEGNNDNRETVADEDI